MNKAHISLAIAIRGMLIHNFVDANFCKYCMWGRGGGGGGSHGQKEKKSHHLGFLLHNIQNLKTLALIAGEKSVMDFYEKERKMDK